MLLTLIFSDGQAAERGNALFTLYYVAEVESASKGGVFGKVKTLDGQWIKYRISHSDHRRANMEGTVVSRDNDGSLITSSIVRIGVWEDLPSGWHGKGNRMNPLHPYRSVAADQRIYPFGSRVFIPEVAGYQTPDGEVLDGYFWVGDSGGRIKGRFRFDLFVGGEPNYRIIKKLDDTKWRGPVVVERLPKPPKDWDPKTIYGLQRILKYTGCEIRSGLAMRLPKQPTSAGRLDPPTRSCLIDFQKSQPDIPQTEYGMAMSSVTLWYLVQTAHKAASDKGSALNR